MEMACGCDELICKGSETEAPVCEQSLWVAVLAQALEDWHGNRLRAKREAEEFLFEDQKDFEIVCAGAGIDPRSFRSQLSRLRTAQRLAPQSSMAA